MAEREAVINELAVDALFGFGGQADKGRSYSAKEFPPRMHFLSLGRRRANFPPSDLAWTPSHRAETRVSICCSGRSRSVNCGRKGAHRAAPDLCTVDYPRAPFLHACRLFAGAFRRLGRHVVQPLSTCNMRPERDFVNSPKREENCSLFLNVRRALIALLLITTAISCLGEGLKYAVILSRHGVRSPTWPRALLDRYSPEPWPDWRVPRGYLTPHGRKAIELMGAYYRRWLASEKLLHGGCADAGRIEVYADKDERTIETGRALAESIVPGCAVGTDFKHGSMPDPLFPSGFIPGFELSVKDHHAALDALSYVLGARHTIAPLTASTLAEDFLLEYTDGMPNPGWGRLTKENLFTMLDLHTAYEDRMRKKSAVVRSASSIFEAILASMEQAESGRAVKGAIGKPNGILLVISGHDSNISNLSGLLGISWTLAGYQPDDTPPGGALIFSLWADGSVKLRYVAQSVDQMRNLEPGEPESEEVAIQGCDPCTWDTFQRIAKEKIASGSSRPVRP